MDSSILVNDETLAEQIFALIRDIRPSWSRETTRLVTFTEGITNSIFGLFDKHSSDGLVIKIFGSQTELFIDRQSELKAMTILSNAGVLNQRVLIQFSNGIIYQFAPGVACSRDDMRDPTIASLIAAKLGQFHSVPLETQEKKPSLIFLMRRFVELLLPEKIDLIDDIDLIETKLLPGMSSTNGEDLVLCHNDLLVKNILFDRDTQQISFIDFEYTHLNYALFDIANHFVEYAGVDEADFSIYPTRDEQKRWLKVYYRSRKIDEGIVTEELCHLIDRYSALAHLMWGLWALVQSRLSQLDFDYLHYAKLRFDSYRRLRTILFETLEE